VVSQIVLIYPSLLPSRIGGEVQGEGKKKKGISRRNWGVFGYFLYYLIFCSVFDTERKGGGGRKKKGLARELIMSFTKPTTTFLLYQDALIQKGEGKFTRRGEGGGTAGTWEFSREFIMLRFSNPRAKMRMLSFAKKGKKKSGQGGGGGQKRAPNKLNISCSSGVAGRVLAGEKRHTKGKRRGKTLELFRSSSPRSLCNIG